MNPAESQIPSAMVEVMVAIGRIEEKMNRIEKLETRVNDVEKMVGHLDAIKPVVTPLWQKVSGVAAAMAIIVGAVNLTVIQQEKLETATELKILQSKQDELIQKVKP